MTDYTATFIKNVYPKGFERKDIYHKLYKYRGYEYLVDVYTMGFPLGESLREQHKYEQEKIDRMIDDNFEPEKYTGECEKGLNMFFDYLDGKEVNWDET